MIAPIELIRPVIRSMYSGASHHCYEINEYMIMVDVDKNTLRRLGSFRRGAHEDREGVGVTPSGGSVDDDHEDKDGVSVFSKVIVIHRRGKRMWWNAKSGLF